jgi:hypothetical protein
LADSGEICNFAPEKVLLLDWQHKLLGEQHKLLGWQLKLLGLQHKNDNGLEKNVWPYNIIMYGSEA